MLSQTIHPALAPTDNSLSHIPPKLRGLVQALHKLAPKFGPVQRTDVYGQIRTIDPRCSRDEFKQLLRAGRAQHLIKTGKKPHKWVSLRPECLTAKISDGRTSEELVDSGHESSSSDEDDEESSRGRVIREERMYHVEGSEFSALVDASRREGRDFVGNA